MHYLSNFFKSIIKACPYSLLGKKCVDLFKEKPSTVKHLKEKKQVLKTGIKTGRNISLVGMFCPFLWYSILSGASPDFILLNVLHSGIIVGFGLVISSVNYVLFLCFNNKKGKQ